MTEYAALVQRSRAWLERGVAERWLPADSLAQFDALERATPEDLFQSRGGPRPLVVALFGGTGVGKSSMLNRLAGAPIARVGVERPTSREVTLYAHEAVELAELPADLVKQVRIQRHSIPERREIVWIDSPDIDSTEESNRRLALAWLPHVDLVIYVMSPERYRDDAGWRVLQQRGQRHGWMFVLNRWDEGDARQLDDLSTILRRSGFEKPLLFATSCAMRADSRDADQFHAIEDALRALLTEHGLQEFERLGWTARLAGVRGALRASISALGDAAAWERRRAAWRLRWEHAAETIAEGLAWPIAAAAGRLAVRERSAVRRLTDAVKPSASGKSDDASPEDSTQPTAVRELTGELWDAWAIARLQEFADGAEVDLRRDGLQPDRVLEAYSEIAANGGTAVISRVESGLRAALARPGAFWQRAGERAARFLSILLPGLALIWIAIRVVQAFYNAGDSRAYLDTNFAIHSLLLVGVAWAIPFGVGRAIRPSLLTAAREGMSRGLSNGLDELGAEYGRAAENMAVEIEATRAAGEKVLEEIGRWERSPRATTPTATVGRALMHRPTPSA